MPNFWTGLATGIGEQAKKRSAEASETRKLQFQSEADRQKEILKGLIEQNLSTTPTAEGQKPIVYGTPKTVAPTNVGQRLTQLLGISKPETQQGEAYYPATNVEREYKKAETEKAISATKQQDIINEQLAQGKVPIYTINGQIATKDTPGAVLSGFEEPTRSGQHMDIIDVNKGQRAQEEAQRKIKDTAIKNQIAILTVKRRGLEKDLDNIQKGRGKIGAFIGTEPNMYNTKQAEKSKIDDQLEDLNLQLQGIGTESTETSTEPTLEELMAEKKRRQGNIEGGR